MKKNCLNKINLVLILAFLHVFLIPASDSFALHSHTAIDLYESGKQLLSEYRGNPAVLLKAKSYFLELIKHFPESPLGYLGMSRIQVIDAYRYDDRYFIPSIKDLALPYALKAMATGPLLPDVHNQYVLIEKIFSAQMSHQETIQQYLALFPDEARTYFLVGEFFCDREEFSLSLEAFQKALSLKATVSLRKKICKRIAWLYLEKFNQPQAALVYYQKALALGEASSNLYASLGITQLRMRNYPSAVDSLRKSLEIVYSPRTQAYLSQAQGYLLDEQGEITKAISSLQDAIAVDEEQSSLLYCLGSLFYKVADYINAYDYFTKVIFLEPRNTDAYYFAGRAAQFLGQDAQARSHYQQYLKLRSDGAEADWIRKNFPELSQK